jgi:single-stranded-DNA-specific exonuclease
LARKPLPAMPVRERLIDASVVKTLMDEGVDEFFARIFASRGVHSVAELRSVGKPLLSWRLLKGAANAAKILADTIMAKKKIVIVADYDSDGATSCAICYLGMKGMGADVSYAVPNRFVHGYGLTPPVVTLVNEDFHPSVIVTVDNGISSFDGIELARSLGIKVVVTDHHLPGEKIPQADEIVNPNQPGCDFPSKNMAGCGVAFYVMAALRDELKSRQSLPEDCPPIQVLLDFVAIGTIADVVKLDENNRLLARLGLERIRHGKAHPGIAALFTVASRSMPRATSKDMGFAIGPRINAAGRLDDMSIGIRCLISDDFQEALELALTLDDLNIKRKQIETGMQEEAAAQLINVGSASAICVFDNEFHEGVIGIVAGRIKEREHRPTVVFAPAQELGLIKGSGRSIPGFHLRDALDLIHKKNPLLLSKFGGHAMAAGLTIKQADFALFKEEFEGVANNLLTEDILERYVLTDGDVPGEWITLDLAEKMATEVWGQGFMEPLFSSRFQIKSQRLIKEQHLKMELVKDGIVFEAMWFFQGETFKSTEIDAVYSIESGVFRNETFVQLLIAQATECADSGAVELM